MAGAGCWPPASSEQNLASRLLRLGLIQPRARARLAGIQLDRPSARRLRRGGGRCAPRCGLGHHSGELCEECVGSLATRAVGVCRAEPKSECSSRSKDHGPHGLAPFAGMAPRWAVTLPFAHPLCCSAEPAVINSSHAVRAICLGDFCRPRGTRTRYTSAERRYHWPIGNSPPRPITSCETQAIPVKAQLAATATLPLRRHCGHDNSDRADCPVPHSAPQRHLEAVVACRWFGQHAVAVVAARKLRTATQPLTGVR